MKNQTKFSKPHLTIFLLTFAAVGGVVLYLSLAAPNPNLPGDLNGDSRVDGADLSFLAANYKTNNASADINNSGTVDVADLSILLSHYGQSLSPTGSFTGSYYNNTTLSGTPVLTRTDSAINFDWGSGSPDPSVPADNFSVRWVGSFTFEAATYTFNVTTNDGMRIYLDNNLILDQWQDQAASFTPTYTATAGTHQVKVEYYEGANTAKAQVSWIKQTGGGGTGSMMVGLNANAVGVAGAQDAHGAVNYARLDTSFQSQYGGHISDYLNNGVKVVMLIPGISPTGGYSQSGVSSINATTWASSALSYFQSQCVNSTNCPALEVLNEPAGSWFWGSNAGSSAEAAAYANLLVTTYNTFHNALGTNSPQLLGSYDGGHAGSTTWGQAVYAANPNIGNYVDGWTDHPYGGCGTSFSAQGDRTSVTNFHTATNKPIWITEVGWPTAVGQACTGDSSQWTEALQADNIYNFVQWARSTGYVQGVFIYDFHDDGGNALYGVERGDGTKKPSYNALKCSAQNLPENCTSTGTITFQINYETGNTSQWSGGIQCAGTNDTGYTYGTMSIDTTTFGEGTHGARIDLPADTINGGSRCEGLEARRPIYGSDHWYGMMYKFPTNWQEPSSAFWGMAIAQLNYQLIWGAPVLLAAHADKVDLTINTGFCNDVNSTSPGCTYSSTNGASVGNVAETKIIPGPIVTNNWYEVIVHAKWTGDPTQGIIEGWYRLKGQTTWNKTVNLTGYPTIQWSNSAPLSVWQSNPSFNVNDKFGAYRGQSTFPMTFWHDNIMDGTDFNSVTSRMP